MRHKTIVAPNTICYADVPSVTIKSDPTEVIADDLVRLHSILSKVELAWAEAYNIDDVCKLSLTAVKVMDFRRKVIGMNDVKQTGFLSPYDD